MRALWLPPCLLLGAGVAVAAVALHGRAWGLLLGLVTTLACLVALPGGWWARLPFALGWIAVLVVLAPQRPEGDYLVAGDVGGYVLLAAGAAVVGGGLVGLLPRRTAADEGRPAGPP